ncbi:MAG: hypothetical protein ACAH83_14060 [Alphaproteobacteria bacterium]
MDDRRSQSVNRLPSSLNFIVAALLETLPQPVAAVQESTETTRHRPSSDTEIYKTTITLDGRQCSVLKDFFDGTVGHIFSCGLVDSKELLMNFTHKPSIKREATTIYTTPGPASRYTCEISMARVR